MKKVDSKKELVIKGGSKESSDDKSELSGPLTPTKAWTDMEARKTESPGSQDPVDPTKVAKSSTEDAEENEQEGDR